MSNDFADLDLPCTNPETMDDWFVDAYIRFDDAELADLAARGIEPADEVARLKALRKRALKACYYDCPMAARLRCLDEGLKPMNLSHGIWGGYTESERRAIHDGRLNHRRGTLTRRKAAEVILDAERREALTEKREALNEPVTS